MNHTISKKNFWKVTLITNLGNSSLNDYLHFINTCAKAGITSLQLREKNLPYNDLFNFGKSLKNLLDTFNIPLIVNDNVNLCLELNAAGVHLGQSDGDIVNARTTLGSKKIIGLSVNTFEQIKTANKLPIDYIGLSAIFPSKSKPDVETIWGLPGLLQASSLSNHPIVAIGGINEDNLYSVRQSGASGIAAIGVFHNAHNPYTTTKNIRKICEKL